MYYYSKQQPVEPTCRISVKKNNRLLRTHAHFFLCTSFIPRPDTPCTCPQPRSRLYEYVVLQVTKLMTAQKSLVNKTGMESLAKKFVFYVHLDTIKYTSSKN